jgi:hypothetical protein
MADMQSVSFPTVTSKPINYLVQVLVRVLVVVLLAKSQTLLAASSNVSTHVNPPFVRLTSLYNLASKMCEVRCPPRRRRAYCTALFFAS